jgi:transcriptional regulator GlxA family with amidase domain
VTRVVFVLVPNVHLLDLAGPAQVFSSASDLGFSYELSFFAERNEVTTHQGLPLRASTTWPVLSPEDLIVIPGWRAHPSAMTHGRLAASTSTRVLAHHRAGGTLVSICAGAAALARMGVLNGRRCTTHHELQDELAEKFPEATVVKDVLFVDDDRVLTSAGIASGVDLALYILAQRHGPHVAARVARTMVVFARRNGDHEQLSQMLSHRLHLNDLVHRTQDVIDERFNERLTLRQLSAICGVSDRTLTRSFRDAVGITPLQYQQELRVERAAHLVDAGSTQEAAAHAVGFSDARMLRRLRQGARIST